jgi:hypothetical protein
MLQTLITSNYLYNFLIHNLLIDTCVLALTTTYVFSASHNTSISQMPTPRQLAARH